MEKAKTLLFLLSFVFLVPFSNFGQTAIFSEGFDYPLGDLPTIWVIDADQPPEWSINQSQIAGGVYPELYMGYGMQAGLSRLISPAIDIGSQKELAIRYKQYMINYAMDWGETIGMDVTFDNGENWQVLWERPLGRLNIPQDEFVYFVNAPEAATHMKIAFRFEGNNQGINGWAIDDIVVEEVVESDLLATNISGNAAPVAAQETTYTVEITNGGTLLQSDYTVILMDEEGNVLANATGGSIAFGEKINVELTWTPGENVVGPHMIYAIVESDLDQNPENNQSRNLIINVQAEGVEEVSIGDGEIVMQHSIPFNGYVPHNLAQTLYLSEEIGIAGLPMTGIMYTSQFDEDVAEVPIQIYLAQTDLTDLEEGWLIPHAFQLVFDGTVDFQKGFNSLYIPFDTPYEYGGGNLVVYTNKSYPEQILWTTFMGTFNDNIIRSRNLDGYEEPLDPMDPPNGYPVFESPNITLFFASGELSVIDNQQLDNIVVYPNPAENIVNIQTGMGQTILKIQLINSLGQVVFNRDLDQTDQYTLDVEHLKSGFYVLQVSTSEGSISKKLMIR